MDKIKNIMIVVLIVIAAFMAAEIIGMKRAENLRNYAIANDCTWTWQGTAYGDDRDYVCK